MDETSSRKIRCSELLTFIERYGQASMLAAKALQTLVATNNTSDQGPICKVIYSSSDPKLWSSCATPKTCI